MIPIAKDVRALVGDWAEAVDNRSLLHEKFALPKVWGEVEKINDAGRWSVLRIVTRGADLLRADSQRLRDEAGRNKFRPDVAERKEWLAQIAGKMARIALPDPVLADHANENAKRFLEDLQKSYKGAVSTFEATLGSRMMVNLAGGVVENAGIALDRCFGLPLIPGSAVKGISRAQALWEIRESDESSKPGKLLLAMLLFGFGGHDIKPKGDFVRAGGADLVQSIAKRIGATELKGCASFLPAYPTTRPVLVVDMVNPHYPEYYSGRRRSAEDNESPIPNYFPAVEKDCAFGFAVLLNRVPKIEGTDADALLAQAREWTQRAVTRKGVGAKTAAGYGWFELGRKQITSRPTNSTSAPATKPLPQVETTPADPVIAKWRGRLSAKENFPAALPEMLSLGSDTDLRRAFETLVPEADRRKLKRNHPYWQSFTSGKHAEAGKKILQRLGLVLN
ncbi:MAG TPA: type III-B CRISPR module RAMP protein Cmr6 [Candidatus Limnocylindria bacterium]|jgi:CRISPR type III-B/RAMP module RAMP protein Cmr6|nr:type III-B CRISPR module RAMP protein Cmr6 [Candidatus Limnocylindria bacterium]